MSNAERKRINVVSFDSDKVKIYHKEDGSLVIAKRTNTTEAINMSQIKEHMISRDRSSLSWEGTTFTVRVPEAISWDNENGVLVTKYFEGENLELLLRSENHDTRKKFVDFTKIFIEWMKNAGIIWRDAAPRNVAVNEETKEICIFDFEKGSLLQDRPYSTEEFNSAIRGIVYEEFAAFLFPEEQQQVFGDVWVAEDVLISQNYFRGRRERILYKRLFGDLKDRLCLKKVVSVQRLMAEVVTPYLVEGKVFFPLIYLAKSKSAEEYINLLLELVTLDRSDWPDFLSRRSG